MNLEPVAPPARPHPIVSALAAVGSGVAGFGGDLRTFANMLGAIGVATTPLRPAGKVQIGDDFVDVVAESFIPEGTKVQVIEIEGNRVVVKEV